MVEKQGYISTIHELSLFIPHNDIKRFLIGQPHGLLRVFSLLM